MLILILIAIICLLLFTGIYAYNIATFAQETLFDSIPGVVYINLENREDRKKLILEEFNKLGIPLDKIYRLAGIPIPKNGHKGCVQSHILALQIAKLNQWKYVAIFEDDAELTIQPSEFKEKVSKAMALDKWDVILLHGAYQEVKEKINDTMYYAKHSTCATGYIIKEDYYDTLLELFKDCNIKMDRDHWEKDGWESNALDQRWNELIERDNWVAFNNNLIQQRNIYSSTMTQTFSNINNDTIKLGLQTVFILKENIPFLREWITYHLNLGFDKIYLYDNTGSIGCDSSTANQNKYNMNFDKIVNMDDTMIQTELINIINDFKDRIEYIKWQPRDNNNNIVYGQVDSIRHYIKNYGTEMDYTAYIDIDEFIFSNSNFNIKEYIINKNADKFVIYQKKFLDRYCSNKKHVIDIYDCIINIDTSAWAPKNIIKNSISIDAGEGNIHSLRINSDNIYHVPLEDFRFNHYNVNKKQIEWMKGFFNKDSFDFSIDTSMSRYKNTVDNILNQCNYCGNMMLDSNELNININTNCIIPTGSS